MRKADNALWMDVKFHKKKGCRKEEAQKISLGGAIMP